MSASSARPLPLSLALQGGASWGAYTWGVLDRLLEHGGFSVDAISGTSAGALNGAVLAGALAKGTPETAREALCAFWSDLSNLPGPAAAGWLNPIGLMLERYGLTALRTAGPSPYVVNPLDLNPMRAVIAAHVDFDAIRARQGPPLYVTATNTRNGLPRVFGPREISLEALTASTCVPQLFQAVEIEGEHYWDGGYSGNPSIWPLIGPDRAQDMLLVQLGPAVHEDVARTALRIRQRINDVTFNGSLIAEMAGIHALRCALAPLQPDAPVVRTRFHRIGPPQGRARNDSGDEFDRSWPWLAWLRDQGRDDAGQFLERQAADVGVRSTLDLEHAYVDARHAAAPGPLIP